MGSALDVMIAYKFVKILATPWKKTDAYKLGIIDDNGDVLIKRGDLKTGTQKKAYTLIHRLVWNIKKLLDKLPPTRTKLGSFAAALWLLKEEWDLDKNNTLLEDSFLDYCGLSSLLLEEKTHHEILSGEYVLKSGAEFYEDVNPKQSILIRNTNPVASVLGFQLIEGIHKNTGKKVILSYEDLLRIY